MSKYQGNIYWDGTKPLIQTRDKFIEWLKGFPQDQWFSFEVSPFGIGASNQQKLYFKWRDILAEELGWDSAAMHEHLKKTYNGGKSTKGMETIEWSAFMAKVLAFAGSNSITLPMGESE